MWHNFAMFTTLYFIIPELTFEHFMVLLLTSLTDYGTNEGSWQDFIAHAQNIKI